MIPEEFKLENKATSEFVGSNACIESVLKCFHTSSALHNFLPIYNYIKAKADELHRKLSQRIVTHLSRCLSGKKKRICAGSGLDENFGIKSAIEVVRLLHNPSLIVANIILKRPTQKLY